MVWKKLCRHCNAIAEFDKLLCKECNHKALQILPADPRERIEIYKLLMESDNPVIKMCAEQLIEEARLDIRAEVFGSDREFDERDT